MRSLIYEKPSNNGTLRSALLNAKNLILRQSAAPMEVAARPAPAGGYNGQREMSAQKNSQQMRHDACVSAAVFLKRYEKNNSDGVVASVGNAGAVKRFGG